MNQTERKQTSTEKRRREMGRFCSQGGGFYPRGLKRKKIEKMSALFFSFSFLSVLYQLPVTQLSPEPPHISPCQYFHCAY